MATTFILHMKDQNINPLLVPFQTPHQTPPFDRIRVGDFEPAFQSAIKEAKEEIRAIADNREKPDFQNTIAALSRSGEKLDSITAVFFNLNAAETNPEMQRIAQQVSPLLTEFTNSIRMNSALFQRVKSVYDHRTTIALNPEEATLLHDTWRTIG